MSAIPVDIPTNVSPAEAPPTLRAGDVAAAESGSFGEHLQRIKSAASEASGEAETSEKGEPSTHLPFDALVLPTADQCFAFLEATDDAPDGELLVSSEFADIVPPTVADSVIDDESASENTPLELLLAGGLVVTYATHETIPQLKLTTAEEESQISETSEIDPKRQVDPNTLKPILAKLPTPNEPPVHSELRKVHGKPILAQVADTPLPASQGGADAAAAVLTVAPPSPAASIEAENVSQPITTSQTSTQVASESVVIDPTTRVEASEIASHSLTIEVTADSALPPAEKQAANASPAEAIATKIKPEEHEPSLDAESPTAAHPKASEEAAASPNVVPPILEQVAAASAAVQVNPASETRSDIGHARRETDPSRPIATNDRAIASPQPATPQSQTPQPLLPTGDRASLPTPPLPAKPSSKPTDGGLSEVDRVRFVQRVARAVHTAAERGGEIRLRLSPPELGSLKLEVIVREGVMNARVEAETATAHSILIDNLPALRERLAEQNVKIDRFDVDVRDGSAGSLADQTAGQADAEAQRNRAGRGNSRRADPSPETSKSPAPAPRVIGQGQINVIV